MEVPVYILSRSTFSVGAGHHPFSTCCSVMSTNCRLAREVPVLYQVSELMGTLTSEQGPKACDF